ncbi:hypothetical protein C2S53_005070 [Perilla frutescens var. hirtella]|uniref:CCHC-type domain-containing protein n=1 Tax=Perilla frutescens var. hirtella TaxID=608512 RepID=A0AAD4P8H8_PERFH|nr:hypothetical protein C2S53_005070 [Perilla frutescens var. hirtella]
MRLDELMGSLRTFEMSLEEDFGARKWRNLALKTGVKSGDSSTIAELLNTISLLMKSFNKMMENANTRSFQQDNQNDQSAENTSRSRNKRMKIRCKECNGFGHVQSECTNTLKKNKTSYEASSSDEDSEENEIDQEDGDFAFIAHQTTSKEDQIYGLLTGARKFSKEEKYKDFPAKDMHAVQNTRYVPNTRINTNKRFSTNPRVVICHYCEEKGHI